MRLTVVTTMDDDDLWGLPLVVQDDSFRKQTMRGCEFWFDCRTDVLEENLQNEKYCELVWRILSEKKQDVEIDEVDKDSVSIQNDMVSSGSGGSDDVGSSDSDNTLSAILPDADTSSAKSVLVEDENTSSISDDAQTIETRDSSNETEEIELETRLKPQETAANAATNKDGEILKDHQQNDGLQDIVTASEPFTTESLLDLCDEPDKGRETPCNERSEKTHLEAVKPVVKDELIINLLTEAREKAESKALLNPGAALIKKRQRDNKGMNTNLIRNTKKKVQGEAGEINIDPVENSAQSKPEIIRGSSVPTQHADSLLDSVDGISQRGGLIVNDSVIALSTSELKNKTGKELRSIAKELKVTHYYKLKKEDLLQRLTRHLNPS